MNQKLKRSHEYSSNRAKSGQRVWTSVGFVNYVREHKIWGREGRRRGGVLGGQKVLKLGGHEQCVQDAALVCAGDEARTLHALNPPLLLLGRSKVAELRRQCVTVGGCQVLEQVL